MHEAEARFDLSPLVAIMARLRDPAIGCAWDVEQDFATIAPYTIEEAYEVADAIARGDMAALRDELGDLLLQVVFHSRIAEEREVFTLSDVVDAITAKIVRRHPHVFGNGEPTPGWEAIKAAERREDGTAGTLDGVALALPALMRAQKLQKRSARAGFDWPDRQGPRDKIDEEIAEIDVAATPAEVMEEAGDLLFTVVNYVRHLGVDAETALRLANAKFERRFRAMEEMATNFSDLHLSTKEILWSAVKADERR